MSKVSFTIYIHINKINGCVYVGQTCQNPLFRWQKNGAGYKTCPRFWKAIQDFGWDNFEHKILYTDLSAQEANRIEIQLIKRYHATDRKYGYNINPGGSSMSEETRNKISISNTGKKRNLKQKENNRQIMRQLWQSLEYREKNLSARTFYNDESYRKKMKESKRKSFEENPQYKEKIREAVIQKCGCQVECVETGEIFKSQTEAAKWAGLKCSSGISACCLKKRQTSGGYHWKFVGD